MPGRRSPSKRSTGPVLQLRVVRSGSTSPRLHIMDSMTGVNLAVLVLCGLCLFLHNAESIMCKICIEGYEDLARCTKVGKCGDGSICYTEVTFNSLGQKLIYSGCRAKQECESQGLIAKRDTLCASCCDKDFCNAETCGLAPPATLECLACDNVDQPEDCETTQLCSNSQNCMTEYRYAGGGKGSYRMGCESSELCSLRDKYVQNFTRSLHDEVDNDEEFDVTSLSDQSEIANDIKREIDDPFAICLSCCDFSYCNLKENCLLVPGDQKNMTQTKPDEIL